jgi:hypothetical protein
MRFLLLPTVLILFTINVLVAYDRRCGNILPQVRQVSPFTGEMPTYSYVMGCGKIPGTIYSCFVLLNKQDLQDLYALLITFKPDARIELVEKLLKQRNQKPMTRNTLEILEDFRKYKDKDTVEDVLAEIFR